LAAPVQVNQFALELMTAKRTNEASAIFRENAKKHPDLWFVHDGLARWYSAQNRFDDAKNEMRQAITLAPPDRKNDLNELLKRLEASQDISR
ncbi:MAG: hypothetical protein ABJB34_11480, partial [Acidobacteriota bacterium]